jgi:hypothetical protein
MFVGQATGASQCCLKSGIIGLINARVLAVTRVRFEAGNKWRFGPERPLQSCGARTRRGTACQKPPLNGKTRCRLHGGLSTGPKTPEGKARIVAAHFKHGRRSRAFAEARKQIWADLRAVEVRMRADGLI